MKKQSPLIQTIKELLKNEQVRSHYELSYYLAERGFDNVSQPQISRILNQLGAVSIKNAQGQAVYVLQRELMMPTLDTEVGELVIEVHHNEALVVVQTLPGAADIISRVLEKQSKKLHILAAIAGDDSVMILPNKIDGIDLLVKKIRQIFAVNL
ncbi:arginine repressor [Pseudoalteromonas tunicata]|jgi:transcriptional regulator of arginine metabolism|uniref:Arginine repressor n=1 Tax=Pseudoalteromonas tunicata D2 TaxID=87626 RepID=A4C4K1_9GAMM|nr:arginine repressor [Pseudoalteromonas tunicata]ATC97036.1 hypothetical protein PTUN_b0691 [Pseudoalteromonas tunicata]AXT33155.1 ArgR family transcriptional regulator [Pseudoalteromonas tunicata]EAR30483.1 arginine repressor [Pseudoalteromonas tunicata D2]MDP4984859.1 ArgR family transcriptional regulator [Pseudoalteromonas tunicata]